MIYYFISSCTTIFANPEPTTISKYTSLNLNDCLLIFSNQNNTKSKINEDKWMCPSFMGHNILFHSLDDRSWIEIQFENKILNFQEHITQNKDIRGAFPNVSNNKLEWIFSVSKDNLKPELLGLIFRVNSSHPETSAMISQLVILKKINDKYCYLGTKDSNESSRTLLLESKVTNC